MQHHQQQETEQAQQDWPPLQAATNSEGDRGTRARANHARIHKSHKRDEQANSNTDRRPQGIRDSPENHFPDTSKDEYQNEDALPDNQTHRLRPRHRRGDDVGKQGVNAQACCDPHRESSPDTHSNRHDGSHEGSHCHHHDFVVINASSIETGASSVEEFRSSIEEFAILIRCGTDDERIESQDVCHREEGDDAAANFARRRRTTFCQVEPLIKSC